MRQPNEDVYVVIPAFNEETVIQKVIEQIRQQGFHNIIVVDDGSEDQTARTAGAAGAIVLSHSLNRGKGAATITGIEAAIRFQAGIIVTMDGDGQHDPHDIHQLIKPILQRRTLVVLGARTFRDAAVPWHKTMQNQTANFVTWLIARRWVRDSQSGFRAYDSTIFQNITFKGDAYEFDSEVVKTIATAKLSFVEVPIQTKYTSYSVNKLHKQNLVNGAKTLYKLLWNAFS